ncbi:hypothetical protein GOQ30_11340 [Flavobacterium sp. TP390]|uniref:Uncharacterized protein n=1 Tax=Flavobacterium profundi TaxID=1774945 RepID=A0A6I4IM73_9FLAO|nr:hypothetical protein [Flavobacterium profundi]MVO09752.1 hypothetical protein [Flavobacterium profundi]
MKKFETKIINVTLPAANSTVDSTSIKLPDGKVIGIAQVNTGNTSGEIINLSILNNGNEVLSPSDLSFSKQQPGGGFLNSLRPVDFEGGYEYNIRLSAYTPSRANNITVQVLFAVVTNQDSSKC